MAAAKKVGALSTSPSTHRNASGQWVNNQGQRVDGHGRVIPNAGAGSNRNPKAPQGHAKNKLASTNKVIGMSPADQIKALGTGANALSNQAVLSGMQYDPNNPMAQWNPQFASYADKAQQSVMDQFNRAMEPQFAREQADFQQRMAEQGIDPNSGRYKTEYQNLQQSHNMQRQNAMDQAYQTGLQAQEQAFNQNQKAQLTPFQFAQAMTPYWQTPYQTQADILRQQMANQTAIQTANIGANSSMFGHVIDSMSQNPYRQSPNFTNSIIQGIGQTIPYWFKGSE